MTDAERDEILCNDDIPIKFDMDTFRGIITACRRLTRERDAYRHELGRLLAVVGEEDHALILAVLGEKP